MTRDAESASRTGYDRGEVRRALLAAGQRWLPAHGTAVSVDLLCRHAGPECFGQEAFDGETLDIGLAVLREHQDRLSTVAGRRAVIAEAIRQAVPRNLAATLASPEWRLYLALVAALPAAPADPDGARVAVALQESVRGFVGRMSEFYQGLAALLGLRFRNPSCTFDHVTTAGAALVEGFAVRQILAAGAPAEGSRPAFGRLLDDPLPGPAPDGGAAQWTLLALAFNGLVDTFFELDPDCPPPGPL
jgi:hypothetical protein